ncbi:MAG: hypothetical protein IJ580_06770 [Prevotella sp.]|nr:hypothetical protein [Prevotella sp.]
MKHLINYIGALLAVVLIGTTFTACSEDDNDSANVGLGIKVFFPTKVVTNQPITINGSGFNEVTEIEFPGGTKVTDFEIVGNDMIRVNTPAGIPADGGKIVVRTANDEAESRLPLTVGHTNVTGFSLQPGEEVTGGDQITVYGSDLEFINSVELLDADGEPQLIDHQDFYRKGTSNLIFRVPQKNIFEGTWVGYLHTYDGQKIAMPELAYKPAADEGHWETVKTVIWTNNDPDGNGAISWNGTYRFTFDGNDGNNECIATFPADIWEKLKSEKFYMRYKPAGDSYQIRVTTGWWGAQWLGKDNDIAPWNMAERIIDNKDGTFTIEVDFAEDPEILETIDAQHLLFTGNGYTPLEIYFTEDVWVGGSHLEIVKTSFWNNSDPDGNGAISWNGTYRFTFDGNDGNNECIATFPADIWEKLKSEKFYMRYKPAGDSYQIRVTTGWWGAQWLGKDNDIAPWNMAERIIDNEDGTFTIEVDFAEDPEILETIDAQHLLFTGNGYTPLELYFQEEVWVGPNDTPSEYDIAPFTMYQDRSDYVQYPFNPSWSDDKGKWRIMRGGNPAIESLGLTTSSKFVVYKEVGTTGQIQWNDPNWASFAGVECNDWDGSAETIEVPITEDMLKCINGEVTDGWSDTAIILQGDGLTVTKIVIVP